MNAQISLSQEERSLVRKAVKDAPGWNEYRVRVGLDTGAMKVAELFEACNALGIDVAAIIATKVAAPADVPASVAHNAPHVPAALPVPAPAVTVVKKAPVMPVSAVASDTASQLAALIAQIAGDTSAPVDMSQVNAAIDARMTDMAASVAKTAAEVVAQALARAPITRIEVKGTDGHVREVKGSKHPKFATLLRAATARMGNGYAPSIWLAGPAGSGKTHAGHMLAESLGLAFHLNGAISMPHELVGFVDAGGTYHRTPFRDAYEHGGVYMFDEVDGSDNAALLALNAALANGHATFPDARIKRHADCIIVASANTWGLGATAEYVGRAKIDAAFLSRFPINISWQYDEELEIAISGNEKFARRVIKARQAAKDRGLKVMIDPRASQAGAALIAQGFSEQEAAELTYLAKLTPDQRGMIN